MGDHLYFRRNYLHDFGGQGFFVKDQQSAIDGLVVEDNLITTQDLPGVPASLCPGWEPSPFHLYDPVRGVTWKVADQHFGPGDSGAPSPDPNQTLPNTMISSGGSTTLTSASFALASSEPNSRFECRLDTDSSPGDTTPPETADDRGRLDMTYAGGNLCIVDLRRGG